MALITLDTITKQYTVGTQKIDALRGITLTIDKGEFTVFAGPSGSGKTTLLNIIGMLDCKTSGTYTLNEEAIDATDFDVLAEKRGHSIGFIFQNFNLMKNLSVAENVELPIAITGKVTPATKVRVHDLIDAVGLSAYRNHKPDELSGGQQQRVAIARALITNPAIILADEPTANLDSQTARSIIELMQRFNKEYSITFLFSTHDARLIDKARKVVELVDGRVKKR